ncbi:MAG: electron transfer flavoprotein subunit alpha/FixB family protein [Gemmatimonadales bacterium]|jgi:electron transfer flavoprotein alpha subunit
MSVIAIAEQRAGALRQTSLEVLTAGRAVADAWGIDLVAIMLGPPGVGDSTDKLAAYGADRILVGTSESFSEYAPEGLTAVLAKVIREREAKAVLAPASAQGKDLMPRLAARLGVGLASDVTEIRVEDGRLVVVRPAYAGKVFVKLAFKSEPALSSVRPRAYSAVENARNGEVEELAVEIDAAQQPMSVKSASSERKARPDVTEAEIIVAGGRGMQGPERWTILEELADALGPQTALGASRAVVDAGWRPHDEQVGQTGKVVAPPLYFAIGISGAIQHLAGMQTSKCIVAVNRDAEAPIFKVADYGIVGDLFEVVPRLTEEIRRLRSEN